MRDSLSGHKTGLPKKLLDLFNPLPPVDTKLPVHRRKPKLPYSGVGQYVDLFAAPGTVLLRSGASCCFDAEVCAESLGRQEMKAKVHVSALLPLLRMCSCSHQLCRTAWSSEADAAMHVLYLSNHAACRSTRSVEVCMHTAGTCGL